MERATGGTTQSFVQASNARAAVDGRARGIVAADVLPEDNHKAQLVPMLRHVAGRLGQTPATGSADAGYFSAASVTDTTLQGIDRYVPPDRQKPGPTPAPAPAPVDGTVVAAMRAKRQTPLRIGCSRP